VFEVVGGQRLDAQAPRVEASERRYVVDDRPDRRVRARYVRLPLERCHP
jgi:hypothetical protein